MSVRIAKDLWRISLASAVLGVLAFAGLAATIVFAGLPAYSAPSVPTQQRSEPSGCMPVGTVVPSPNDTNGDNHLRAVSAVSANDVWAVGNVSSVGGVIHHWDGNGWNATTVPAAATLYGVAAASANDVWAVGDLNSSTPETWVMHWNGTQWSRLPSPSPGTYIDTLHAVTALSANDVWAVGFFSSFNFAQLLAIHWDGAQWSNVPLPAVGQGHNILYGVAGTASNDVWAVGSYCCEQGRDQTLVLHWNGSSWSRVASPNPGVAARGNYLYGVSALSATDAWATGYYVDASNVKRTLVAHWDGSEWQQVASPNEGNEDNVLRAIVAVSADEVWAAGYYGTTDSTALVERWNGSTWSVVPAPPVPDSQGERLFGIDAVSSNDVWAAGDYEHVANGQPQMRSLTERFSVPCVSQTPVVTATTTRTSTPTPTPTSSGEIIGHLTWQGISQPDPSNVGITATLTLCAGGAPQDYTVSTDASGFFTITTGLPDGTYNWHFKGRKWLANNGTVTLSGGRTNQEFGTQRAGDSDDNNIVTIADFHYVRISFGRSLGDPGYDERPNFNNDNLVNIIDFNLLKPNFSNEGARTNCQ